MNNKQRIKHKEIHVYSMLLKHKTLKKRQNY